MSDRRTPGSTEHLNDTKITTKAVLGFRLDVINGQDKGACWQPSVDRQPTSGRQSTFDRCVIGSHESCDFPVRGRGVSRFHCELISDAHNVRIRDLDSRNGTVVDGLRIKDAFLKRGSVIELGRAVLRFQFLSRATQLALSERTSFGLLVGHSSAMRRMFAMLERAAASSSTILLEGETGTGKTATARSIHQESKRKDAPFIMIDCSALPANLLESELFGHEKGAFTGAHSRRIGAFEAADGGTVFLDELGELPLSLQTKLLSVIENREFRRIGSNRTQQVDVRVIAATNRNLRAEVNAARFREDLYYRLSVISVEVPPLRERLDDLPLLVESLLSRLSVSEEQMALASKREFLQLLSESAWPGNIRELRNYLERYLLFQDLENMDIEAEAESGPDTSEPADEGGERIAVHTSLPFSEARQRAISEFERIYLTALLGAHEGKVSRAATGANMARAYLYRLLQRHQLISRPN